MHAITSPQPPKVTTLGESQAKFEIGGCFPGYGATLGNALRRVLLSSLPGAAIRSVKIKGVAHEFSTLPGVLEDVVQIILNLKQVRFRSHSDEAVTVSLKAKGEGAVTGGSIKCPASVEVVNPDQLIATLTDKKSELDIDLVIDRGLGYVPVEARENEEREIGEIAIDAVYTPIKRVNYEVENMRVGKRTDYDKITLDITTDGTLSPQEAFRQAAEILVTQFSSLLSEEAPAEVAQAEAEVPAGEVSAETELTEQAAKKDKKEKKEKVAKKEKASE